MKIKNEDDAEKLARHFAKMKDEIKQIKEENQLDGKEAQVSELSKQLALWLHRQKKDEIKTKDGRTVKLVERRRSFWIWDTGEVPDNIPVTGKIKPLKKVLQDAFSPTEFKKAREACTTRVIDPAALDDFVRGLKFESDQEKDKFFKELGKANVEYVETRYVQRGSDG